MRVARRIINSFTEGCTGRVQGTPACAFEALVQVGIGSSLTAEGREGNINSNLFYGEKKAKSHTGNSRMGSPCCGE